MQRLNKPLKLSELMKSTTFELNSLDTTDFEEESEGMFWNEENQDVDAYKNPCGTSFVDWKAGMIEISDGVFKKILKSPAENAKDINLQRNRVTYHRNLYEENEDQPFDSTYLNGKTDEICLPTKREKEIFVDGILEALESMKEGEQSLFIISYKKMFGETGCPPRIQPKADILCDLKVVKVEDIGDQEAIDKLLSERSEVQKFSEIKESVEETRIRATDYFSKKKFDKAIKLYQRIIQTVGFASTSNEAEREQKLTLLKLIHTNIAVCSNKVEDWQQTMEHIRQLENLEGIDDNAKALHTKGRALTMLGENDAAMSALVKAQKLRPVNEQINEAIEELMKRKNTYEDFNKTFAKNLKLS